MKNWLEISLQTRCCLQDKLDKWLFKTGVCSSSEKLQGNSLCLKDPPEPPSQMIPVLCLGALCYPSGCSMCPHAIALQSPPVRYCGIFHRISKLNLFLLPNVSICNISLSRWLLSWRHKVPLKFMVQVAHLFPLSFAGLFYAALCISFLLCKVRVMTLPAFFQSTEQSLSPCCRLILEYLF